MKSCVVDMVRQQTIAVVAELTRMPRNIRGYAPNITAKPAIIGVTLPVGRANAREIIRSLLRAFDAITADIGRPVQATPQSATTT